MTSAVCNLFIEVIQFSAEEWRGLAIQILLCFLQLRKGTMLQNPSKRKTIEEKGNHISTDPQNSESVFI